MARQSARQSAERRQSKQRTESVRVVPNSRASIGAHTGDRFHEASVVPPNFRRGRGAVTNPSGRFEPHARVADDDGWDIEEDPQALDDDGWDIEEDPQALRTEVQFERPRKIITRNESPDISFDRSINPYRGCEHGCVYCFARPTHSFMGLSPGLDFETKLFVKEGAADLLERELSARNYAPRTIAMGTNTDPYQPIERQYRVTRSVLEVLQRANHPVGIVTKSALILRDLDILSDMAARGLAKVAVSVTTLDRSLARTMEPRASTPDKRLHTIEELAKAGVPTGVMVAPIVPAINDAEIETILGRAHALGAREAGYVMLRLPLELKDLFTEWLVANFPGKARHVLSLVRDMRDGKLNDAAWGKRMTASGPYAWAVGRRFEIAAGKLGFNTTRVKLRTDLFSPPHAATAQLSLF